MPTANGQLTPLSTQEASTLRCIEVCLKRDKVDLASLLIQSLQGKLTPTQKGKLLIGLIDMVAEGRRPPAVTLEPTFADGKPTDPAALKPCNCGVGALTIQKDERSQEYFVLCEGCNRTSRRDGASLHAMAIERWNKFVGLDPIGSQ